MDPAALADLKRRRPCDEVAAQWVTLRRGRSGGKIGPCPICSSNPASRTAARFEVWTDRWVCAVCAAGGDVVELVRRRRGDSFEDAVAWLGGTGPADSARERRLAADRASKAAKTARDAEFYRTKELTTLRGIWERARPLPGSAAEAYLRRRGITAPIGAVPLRCVDDMPYYHGEAVIGRAAAMVAMIEREGALQGLHFTYLDLTRPNGKAAFADAEGTPLPAKKCRGRVAGGHIALIVPAAAPLRLILGEGIETVLSVWQRYALQGLADGAAFWTGVSLGNMGGAATATIKHPILRDAAGRPRRVPGPVPDLSKPSIRFPAVRDLVLLRDGDSDPTLTQMALERTATRFYWQHARNTLVRMAAAPAGLDYNDWDQAEG
jgi:hypothetical protein